MTFEEELFGKYASDGWSGDASAVGPDSFRTALMKYKNYLRELLPEIPEAVPAPPKKCKHGDPFCPCQDGDSCNHEPAVPASGERPALAWHLFHRLWTKAVGSADYVKQEWCELEASIPNPNAAPPSPGVSGEAQPPIIKLESSLQFVAMKLHSVSVRASQV